MKPTLGSISHLQIKITITNPSLLFLLIFRTNLTFEDPRRSHQRPYIFCSMYSFRATSMCLKIYLFQHKIFIVLMKHDKVLNVTIIWYYCAVYLVL